MTSDQVRWKINALIKKYKECVDNNSKSGRVNVTFEFYDQLEEILGQEKRTSLYTVASNVLSDNTNKKVKDSKRQNVKSPLNHQKRQNNYDGINQPSTSAVQHESSPVVDSKRHLPGHNTGSNLARMKIELQTQCLDYFKTVRNREEEQTKWHEKLLQSKEATISVKKRQLELKKQIAEKKLKSKECRHEEIMEIERLKVNLLKTLIKNKENIKEQEDNDSE